MDIVVWLRSLGLGKYEAIFRENEIDETVLPNLTAEDLKELGGTALGHRRKLLAAIAALRSEASAKASFVEAATPSSTQSAQPEDRRVAPFRHAKLAAIKLAGDPNNPLRMWDTATKEELKAEIMKHLKILAPVPDL